MFIAVPNAIKNQVVDVSPGHWRLQAAILKCTNSRLLIINSYFPVDSRGDGGEVLETLEAIKHITEHNVFDNIVWLGDINCDFARQTQHTMKVHNFLEENSLRKSWEKFEADFTMFHEIQGQTYTSLIDHFFWNEGLHDKVSDAGVFHSPDNLSDHSPTYCVISDSNDEINPADDFQPPGISKPNWKRASTEEKESFQIKLDDQLNNITIPQSAISCVDVHCQDPQHCNDVDTLMISILENVEQCAIETLPVSKPPNDNMKKKPVPGWSEEVQPFRKDAFFWHGIWKSAGRPVNTVLHNIMKKTRNLYHYQLKKVRKSEELIRKNKLLDACINGSGDIFSELKKMRSHKATVASSMDGNKKDIPNHFKDIYSKLYNSVDDLDNLNEMKSEN